MLADREHVIEIISIHALRKESDRPASQSVQPSEFQSTLSVRRATVGVIASIESTEISIHALRKESDE